MTQQSLAARIEQQLARQPGVRASVEVDDGVIRLSGTADSEEARDSAVTTTSRLAPGTRIENHLDVETTLSEDIASLGANDPVATDLLDDLTPLLERGTPGDFTRQPLDSYAGDAVTERNASVDDLDLEEPDDTVYFPPTDPVIATGDDGKVEVLGGFTPTSMTSDEVEPSAEDRKPGDEALADAIRRELREDAATTDLHIQVNVERSIAYLRGRVQGIEDVENAEEVAARIPGVQEVVEELTVADL